MTRGIALVCGDGAVTWGDANACVAGVDFSEIEPGDRVALVSASRGIDEPLQLWAALDRGATIVPLDATAPPARLASICDARGVKRILHDDAAEALVAKIEAKRDRTIASDENDPKLACILHTSGSTGTPKPVPITREGLDAFVAFMIDLVELDEEDRVLRVAELVFDLAWFDHVATRRAKATLICLDRRALAAGRALADAIAREKPTVIYGVPSMFMKLTAALKEGESIDARAIFFAGEVFPPRELRAFAERAPNARLFNLYGPTETNVCTYHEVNRDELDGERELPIGKATPYARCAIEDGELVVSGPTTIGGGPYKTRDRVEEKDGVFWFRGRIDRMVKVRGYRVEPGEVEAQLARHPSVRQAAVIPFEDPKLGKTLRAFVSLTPGAAATERDLRMHLAERLPSYMIPDKVKLLEDLPRTVTGKIDYGRLA